MLQDNTCLNCHTGTGSGGLDLSTYDGVLAGGVGGPSVNEAEHVLFFTNLSMDHVSVFG